MRTKQLCGRRPPTPLLCVPSVGSVKEGLPSVDDVEYGDVRDKNLAMALGAGTHGSLPRQKYDAATDQHRQEGGPQLRAEVSDMPYRIASQTGGDCRSTAEARHIQAAEVAYRREA